MSQRSEIITKYLAVSVCLPSYNRTTANNTPYDSETEEESNFTFTKRETKQGVVYLTSHWKEKTPDMYN